MKKEADKKNAVDAMPRVSWMRLDNSAQIYPAAKSKKWPALYRVSMELYEDVNPDILQKALDRTLKRFPGYAQRLRYGLFWYYFEKIDERLMVEEDVNNPCICLDTRKSKGYMIRVRYYNTRIAVEFFHALADGYGAYIFLKTLVAEYITIRFGAVIPRSQEIFDCDEPPKAEEYEDSFIKYARPVKKSRKEESAYHIVGTRENVDIINITSGYIGIKELKTKAKEYSATVNEFLTAVLIKAIYDVQQKDKSLRKRCKPIKVCIPISLRKYYKSLSLRNFMSYVNVGIDTGLGEYSLEEIINIVKHMVGLGGTEKMLNAKMSTNVSYEENRIIRGVPLIFKILVMKTIYKLNGNRYNSCTFSNLGVIKLPEDMSKYVRRIDCMIGPGNNPVSCSCVGYGELISFCISRTIKEPWVEQSFFTQLVKMGIKVKIESNQR